MDKKELIQEIEDAVKSYNYDLAKEKIKELNIDVVALIGKVKEVESCYSDLSLVGGVFQKDLSDKNEYENMKKKALEKLYRKQAEFIIYLNRSAM